MPLPLVPFGLPPVPVSEPSVLADQVLGVQVRETPTAAQVWAQMEAERMAMAESDDEEAMMVLLL